MSDNEGLSELLRRAVRAGKSPVPAQEGSSTGEESTGQKSVPHTFSQWLSQHEGSYLPAGQVSTTPKIPPAIYEIHESREGLYFKRVKVKTEDLLRLPDSTSEKIIGEIQKFWGCEDLFAKFNISYKRGILLWGPAGGGKTSTIQILSNDIIDRGGIVIRLTHPLLFIDGMRLFREIEPTTPVVVTIEDIDAILERYNESDVLNILDGIEKIERCVFLATTNYPEKLGARIVNRPSRFDKRFKIDFPNAESRKMYLEHLFKGEAAQEKIDQWVLDTDKFTLAHLKELFIAVHILGDDYATAVKTLSEMREEIIPDKEFSKGKSKFGFNSGEDEDHYDDDDYEREEHLLRP